MGLKAILETTDGLDEATKPLYAEHKVGEKTVYMLDVEDIDNHPKVRGVITANQENARKALERQTKIEELEARVSVLPEDFDADEWTRLKAGGDGKGDEAIQALKDQHARAIEALKAKHAKDLSEKETAVAERDSYIDSTLIEGGLKDALLDVGVKPELLDGALAVLRSNVKVNRSEDGKRKAVVETDLGEVGIADFVKEWSGGKGKHYLGPATGPEAKGNAGRGGSRTITRAEFEKMTPQAKATVDFSKTTLVD